MKNKIIYPLLILLFQFFSLQAQSFDIQIASPSLSQSQASAAHSLVAEVTQKLPPKYLKNISLIQISFQPFETLTFGMLDDSKKNIILNTLWLEVLADPKILTLTPDQWGQAYLRQHPLDLDPKAIQWPQYASMKEFFIGVLIHEISHVYDYLDLPYMEYLHSRKQCILAAALNERNTEDQCAIINSIRRSLSDLPEFRTLAGFPQRGFIFADNSESVNNLLERSPDPYEQKNPEEAFAVNMEFFLTDPQYQCRRPLLHEFFTHYYQWTPFANIKCQRAAKVFLTLNNPRSFQEVFETLDFSRLYRIDYLWAGPGAEMSSRFGHAMLRFVFCKKQRRILGPECVQDISDHRVVSFRATLNDFEIDSWKGLTGAYSTYLYIMPLTEVLYEYTRIERRDLLALPLNLSSSQKLRLFELALQYHWGYKSSYKFLSNNCAHETLSLITAALYDQPQFHDIFISRPDTLYQQLRAKKLGLGYSSDALKEHPVAGLFYPSQEKILNALIEKLVQAHLMEPLSLDDFADLSFHEQYTLYTRIVARHQPAEITSQWLYAFLGLEMWVYEKYVHELFTRELPQIVEEHSIELEKVFKDKKMNLTTFFGIIEKLSTPWGILNFRNGYGIPQKTELANIDLSVAEENFNTHRNLYEKVIQWALRNLSSQGQNELQARTQLLQMLHSRLKPRNPQFTALRPSQ